MNDTIRNLSSEVTQLGTICKEIREQLEALAKHYNSSPKLVNEQSKLEDARLEGTIKAQLVKCYRAIRKLRNAISSVYRDRSNFVTQTVRFLFVFACLES